MCNAPEHRERTVETDAEKTTSETPRAKGGAFSHWRRLSWPARIMALPVYFYRVFISPLKPPICRYQPTCSQYALEALAKHGALRGTWLALRRLSRCHPFESLGGGQGYDPVPEPRERARGAEQASQEAERG